MVPRRFGVLGAALSISACAAAVTTSPTPMAEVSSAPAVLPPPSAPIALASSAAPAPRPPPDVEPREALRLARLAAETPMAGDRGELRALVVRATGAEPSPVSRAFSFVRALAWSPDGATLAVGDGGDVILLSARDLDPRAILELAPAASGTVAVAFSRDGARVAAAAYTSTARFWDVETGRGVATTGLAVWPPQRFVLAADGVTFAEITERDGTMVAEIATLGSGEDETKWVWERKDRYIGDVAFVGRDTVALGLSARVELVDVRKGRVRGSLPIAKARRVVVAPEGGAIVVLSGKREVSVWSSTGARKKTLSFPGKLSIYDIAVSRDGARLAFGDEEGRVAVVEVASGKSMFEQVTRGESVFKVALSPDGAQIAAARQGMVSRFDVASGEEVKRAAVVGCLANEQVFPAAWCGGE